MVIFMMFIFLGFGYLFPVLESVKEVELNPSTMSFCGEGLRQKHRSLLGSPTAHFRDNLLNDTYYITGWSSESFTNKIISLANMIYLGKLTDRVPILPPFTPDQYMSPTAGIIPFGDIFDLPTLRAALSIDIIDWHQVKALPAALSSTDIYVPPAVDTLSCWTTVPESSPAPTEGTHSTLTSQHLGLDAAYVRLPPSARLTTDKSHVILAHLAALIFPNAPLVSEGFETPDDHLACFDSLYHATSGAQAYEWERSWSPAWRTVGRHLRFTAALEDLAKEYVRRAFKLASSSVKARPFVAVHIRRGDFVEKCKFLPKAKVRAGHDCLPSLSVYEKQVDDVIEDVWLYNNIFVPNVIVMSDETSPEFWQSVKDKGWSFINHTEEATSERLGEWYIPIIDSVIQSHAIGFVGTESSTFSLLAERRVKEWKRGLVREVPL